jgi:hypothetical protein
VRESPAMDIVPGDELQDADLFNAMLIHESLHLRMMQYTTAWKIVQTTKLCATKVSRLSGNVH